MLDLVQPEMVNRFAEHAVRYMRCYAGLGGRQLSPAQVHYAMTKYKSHREASEKMFEEWERAEQEGSAGNDGGGGGLASTGVAAV